jgi:type III secretory pathway component EscU
MLSATSENFFRLFLFSLYHENEQVLSKLAFASCLPLARAAICTKISAAIANRGFLIHNKTMQLCVNIVSGCRDTLV